MKTISLSRPMNLIQRYVAIRCLALAMVAAVFAPHVARTQTPVDDLIFTVGTTYRSGNQDWSFVLVGAADAALVRGKRFAVFGKPGDASAAGTYTQRGTMFRQSDPTAVNTLLNQSVSLGQDLTGLADSINMLLRRVPGITNQPLPQKVLTLFQNAETNASSAAVLALLTVGHPGLRLCLGQAFAETLPTTTTYEVREVNPLTGVAANVVGRVTVIPGAPVILPAPGRPFQVATNHPDDHLVVRLRWGTPDALRRLSLLGYGFNVWRIPRTAAESANFHVTPPTVAQLYANPTFQRINEGPVITTRDYSIGSGAGAANDPADRETYFVTDNNGRRKKPAAERTLPFEYELEFADGAEFYYFITARDVLGRDGFVSPGGLGRACRRIPPLAPIELSARDAVQVLPLPGGGNTNVQRIRVNWQQRTNATEYWIYRWPNPGDALRTDLPPTENRIGIVSQVGGTNSNSYLDAGPTAPVTPGLSNFWYTVRAVDVAACDPLPSPHSPPVSAVLRVREGPAAGTGSVRGSCGTVAVMLNSFNVQSVPEEARDRYNYKLTCVRRDPGIAWVQFAITNSNAGVTMLGPVYFPPGGDTVEMDYTPLRDPSSPSISIACTVGNYYGAVSRAAFFNNSAPAGDEYFHVGFLAGQLLLTAMSNVDPLLPAAGGNANTFCAPAIDLASDESGTVTMRFDHTRTLPVLVQASKGPNSGVWVDVAVAFPDANGVYAVSYPDCLLKPLPEFRGCIVSLPDEGDCGQHITRAGADGKVAPIQIKFFLTPRTREFRLYRTVNGGPFTLLSQGAAKYNPFKPFQPVVRTDDTMPTTAARLCYYLQLLDEHGNPSPMTELGCRDSKPEKPPTPVLAEPQAVGTPANPQVKLNWFCPTAGVHRFRVYIKTGPGAPSGGSGGLFGADLRIDVSKSLAIYYSGLKKQVSTFALRDVMSYNEVKLTPSISAGFGPGPQFSLVANVYADTPYQISVQALDAQGGEGDLSSQWEFTWKTPPPVELVPWPARPLPEVQSFDSRVAAVVFTNSENNKLEDSRYPVGIRIGQLPHVLDPVTNVGNTNYAYYFRNQSVSRDPNSHVFKRQTSNPERSGELLLPIVVYRQQVTNSLFPRVSGDVTQVSPMIERLPWSTFNFLGDNFTVVIVDRLIASRFELDRSQPNGAFYLYLRDQQPVLLGARYRYFAVRFKANREVDYIIPAGEVEIPLGSL